MQTTTKILHLPSLVLPHVWLSTALWLLAPVLRAQSWVEITKATAADREVDDRFGYAVAISGDYALIGAPYEDEDTAGMDSLLNAGAAYVFERDAMGQWQQMQKLVASDRAMGALFGNAVAISGDYAIVGAYLDDTDATGANSRTNAGAAYIFKRDASGQWTEVQKLVASDRAAGDYFGVAVDISGTRAIVGAFRESHDASGGNRRSWSGSAYLFERDGSGTWQQVQKLVASDRAAFDEFGIAVALSGDRALVGAHYADEDANGGNALGEAGAAYVFERDTSGTWQQVQKLTPTDRTTGDYFGYSVDLSGDYALIGAYRQDSDANGTNALPDAGAAYLFERDASGTWTEVQKLTPSDRAADDAFGIAVSIDGSRALIGAYHHDRDANGGNPQAHAGAAYLFERDASGNWTEVQKLTASDRQANDAFGQVIALSANDALIGAPSEDHNANGSNYQERAGAAYFFQRSTALNTPLTTFKGYSDGSANHLFWSVAIPHCCRSITLQQSRNGIDYIDLAAFAPMRNGINMQRYTYRDVPPSSGIYYYRLCLADYEGHHRYSHTVVLTTSLPSDALRISYRLSSRSALCSWNLPRPGTLAIDVFHVRGYRVYHRSFPHSRRNNYAIDLNGLPAGIYYIRLKTADRVLVRKIPLN